MAISRIAIWVALLLLSLPTSTVMGGPPNIVFILADDLGARDLTCYGSNFYETPHLDRMAAEGVRFTQAYAACQVCSPTRAAIMTGKYPARFPLTNFLKGTLQPPNSPVLTAEYLDALPREEITIADLLSADGYATGQFGKWHLGGPNYGGKAARSGAADQGFRTAIDLAPHGAPPGAKGKPDKNTQWLTDRAIEFIEANRERPFFCYLPYHTVHIPLEADAKLIEKYRGKAATSKGPQTNPIYAAMIEEMDTQVGRLLAKLDELKLAENTLVVFTSDNGGLSVVEGPNTPATSNAPLRASKGFIYEGGIRVPLIAQWPGKIPAAGICATPVCSIDWLPTFAEVAGSKAALPADVDGMSIVKLLTDPTQSIERDLFWHYPHFANQGGTPAAAIRSGKWKLIEFYEDGKRELYDLSQDESESHDVAADHPEKASELYEKLSSWRKSVHANMPQPNPAFKR